MLYYDRQGNPITRERFNELDADVSYRTVRNEYLENGLYVSTIWVGLDRGLMRLNRSLEKPIIFDTAVFEDLTLIYQRYSCDEDEALSCHEDAVKEFKNRPQGAVPWVAN
ncbi:hypothetical protein IAQ67_28945 (plasmid) [Paenibacillus peoriae]|uniref:Uncharacterized protein n=1 Tax=Paenibacillus peoriae TaxID=59893 RepID=A0A7H0YH26_9BACL|nr:hypothetical protein [Paenibacillus peoriae]QNR70384.1 hypothetical protein IAQ67_28945 [Paenibacillus peoriae]